MVIILGDVHLGGSQNLGKTTTGLNINSRISDQLNILDWTLEQAIEHNVNDIIITGDVFEEPKPPPNLVAMFIAWIKRCQGYDVNVHVIIGNHDILRSGMVYSSPLDIIVEAEIPNAYIYHNFSTITIDYTSFTLMPFRDRKSFSVQSNAEAVELVKNMLVYELESIPKTYGKVIVGHFAVEGSIYVGGEIDDIANEIFCPISMFAGYDHVWMGHVHSPQVLNKTTPYVAHIGSMDISGFSESAHKKHIILFDTIHREYSKIDIPTRDLQKLSITVPDDTEDPTAYVLEEIKKSAFNKAIVKLEINVGTNSIKPVNKNMVEKGLKDIGAFSVAGISETKQQAVVKKENAITIDAQLDVISAINKFAESRVEEAMRSDYIQLATNIYNQLKLGEK